MRSFWHRQRSKARPLALAGLGLALGLPAIWFSLHLLTGFYFEQTARRGENTLVLAVSMLEGQLERFRQLPDLLAEQQSIQLLAGSPDDPVRIEAMNNYLDGAATLLEASDIYIMRSDGTTIAASNHRRSDSFIGHNFAYRPYFFDAIRGGRGSFFALGTTSLKRGYYFGAPIYSDTGVTGVIALKVDLDPIEAAWLASDYEIAVTDPEGIIFMSGRPDWLFSSLQPLTPERIARTNETRRYANAELTEMPLSRAMTDQGRELLTIGNGPARQEYLAVSRQMPQAGWTVTVFLEAAPARGQAVATVALVVLASGLGLAGLMLWQQRRARLAERLSRQHEMREQLEARVAARTADLAEVNLRLEEEVTERRNTEERLRQTQTDLVQAAKLAAVGQMSAELSHEFNQPLAALRSYVDSAQVLIDRDRVTDARQYLQRIDGLAERMTSISRHLSNFARKPGQQLRAVPLDRAIAGAVEMLEWRSGAEQAVITTDLPETPLFVRAGTVRLQQVLVNIISNALDAAGSGAQITISARAEGDRVRLTITDNGPGIPEQLLPRIFDPFFSTKGIGRGLGLGLSISYNIIKDFSGELTATNLDGGGAAFTILLARETDEAAP